MPYSLSSRMDYLGSRKQSINKETVSYHRGSDSISGLDAERVIAIDPEEVYPGVPITRLDKLDWLIDTADLILLGSPITPRRGDYIQDSTGQKWRVVSYMDSQPLYEYTTSTRVRMRIHSEEVGEVELPPTYSNRYSLQFDGVDEYLSIPNYSYMGESGKYFSFFCWVKPDAQTFQWYAQDFNNDDRAWRTRLNNNGNISFMVHESGGNSPQKQYQTPATAEGKAAPGEWSLIGFTWDGSGADAIFKLWVNGIEPAPITKVLDAPFTHIYQSPNPVILGAGYYSGGPQSPYGGLMDEASLWSKALTAAEILELYNSGEPGDLQSHSAVGNLKGWYRMGDGATYPTIPDGQGVAPDATMINMEAGDIVEEVP